MDGVYSRVGTEEECKYIYQHLAINHGIEFVRDLRAKEPQIRKMDRPMENGKR